jgi:hypothetical protein
MVSLHVFALDFTVDDLRYVSSLGVSFGAQSSLQEFSCGHEPSPANTRRATSPPTLFQSEATSG